MSTTIQIADDLVALLKAPTPAFPMTVGKVERRWLPDWEIADVASLRIGVLPISIESARLSRKQDQTEHEIHVAVMKHLGAALDTTEIDPYVEMALAVCKIIAAGALPTVTDAKLLAYKHQTLVSLDYWQKKSCFFSLISCTWLTAEDIRA